MSYECPCCRGEPGVRPIDGRPFKEVEVGDCVLEAVDRFCYLGDILSAGGGSMAAATARCRCAWGKFRENLPLLTSKPVPFDLRGRLFSSNVRSSMLHGTETWPMTSDALHWLCRNDRAIIRWICGVKPSGDSSMDDLHAKLGICDLAVLVREYRLRWFGHVMRSNGEINRVRSKPVPGRKGPGRPKKTWDECVKQDLKVCGLSEAGTQDRVSWRSSVKNSRQEPTPSNGSAPQSMAVPPARRVLGMRTRSFNKTGFDWLISWWRHQMETFSVLLDFCARNSPVTGEFPAQRPVTRSFDVFFDLRLNKSLSKQSWGSWFETPSRPLWHHCNVVGMVPSRSGKIFSHFWPCNVCVGVPSQENIWIHFIHHLH